MAESDGKPASSPLSTEEADRLSEKFKPSWETEPEPPTVPKVDPPKNLKQTLLGIAAPAPSSPPPAGPSKAPDDLDWELPTQPVASPLEEAQAIEPPPKSNPSGIGQTYKPKDTDAPAIVLKDEVQRAEETARAQLAAEHRARRAPTILKFKLADVQSKASGDDLDSPEYAPPTKGLGVWIGLGAGAVAIALIGIMLVVRGTSSPEPAPPPPEIKAAPPPVVPEPPPPPPPALTPAPAPIPEPPAAAEPAAPPTSPPAAAVPDKAAEPAKPEPIAKPEPRPAKPAAAPKPAAPAKPPKPVAAAPKAPPTPKAAAPAPKPAAAPKPASGAIVRDAPF